MMATETNKKTWSKIKGTHVPTPSEVTNFMSELKALYQKYNLSISHEDEYGSFIIERFDPENYKWLSGASINFEPNIESNQNREELSNLPDEIYIGPLDLKRLRAMGKRGSAVVTVMDGIYENNTAKYILDKSKTHSITETD